jgi:hypothetical protein
VRRAAITTSLPGHRSNTLSTCPRPGTLDIRHVWWFAFGEDITQSKKSGADQYRTLCPFHSERNPSCDVSTRKNVFFCRSCGACGGTLDVIVRAGFAETRTEAAAWLKERGAL